MIKKKENKTITHHDTINLTISDNKEKSVQKKKNSPNEAKPKSVPIRIYRGSNRIKQFQAVSLTTLKPFRFERKSNFSRV